MRIAIYTCDNYLWIAPIFLHFYRKFWPENFYQTDFLTEKQIVQGESTFRTGDISWTNRMINYLNSFEDKLFILLLIDYIIDKKVDVDGIKRAESLCKDDIGCVRLCAHDELSRFLVDSGIKGFKEYPSDKPYSLSWQPSIWQKEYFLETIQEGDSIWRAETRGSKIIQNSKKKTIWSDNFILSHINPPAGLMQKGKIIESVERWIKENW